MGYVSEEGRTPQAALSRGIKRFKLRVARGINRELGREGSVFFDRYHMEILRSPRQTRNVICYVLQNARKHGERVPGWRPDPFSSGRWFGGWRDDSWRRGLPPPAGERCVAEARTWLLSVGWRRCGLIEVDEVPASRRPRRS